jgi:hypothetical protein
LVSHELTMHQVYVLRVRLVEEGAEDGRLVEDEFILLEVPGREESVSYGGTDEPDSDCRFITWGIAESLLRKLGNNVSKSSIDEDAIERQREL